MNTDDKEKIGQKLIDLIVEEDLCDAFESNVIVWSGRAPYVIGDRMGLTFLEGDRLKGLCIRKQETIDSLRSERDSLQAQVEEYKAYLQTTGLYDEFKSEGPWLQTKGDTP